MSNNENEENGLVRDEKVYEAQHAVDSHAKFFEGRANIGSVGDDGKYRGKLLSEEQSFKAAIQENRRKTALQQMADTVVLERVKPGSSPSIEYISFESWQKLQQEFDKAVREHNMPIREAANEVGFMPFSVYGSKFKMKDNGKWFPRPPLQHEVGVRPTGKIVLLEDKMPGDVGTVVVGRHTQFKRGGEEHE